MRYMWLYPLAERETMPLRLSADLGVVKESESLRVSAGAIVSIELENESVSTPSNRRCEMRRYKMDLVVRYEDPIDLDTSEKILKCNVTSPHGELVARRVALERAWGQGMIVRRFLTIEKAEV